MISRSADIFDAPVPLALTDLTSSGIERTVHIHSTFPSLASDDLSRREIENFQLALVMRNSDGDGTAGLDRNIKMGQVLLLPWTWKEPVTGIRDYGPTAKNSIVQFGLVRIDFSSLEVWRGEFNVKLTAMEFKVLRFFVLNQKRVISRNELLNEVWGYENYPNTRTVDNHIMRLRKKLELDPAHPIHFQTVHGVGYKFVL